ncbi:hypothetical protein MMC07_009096 [Pseudocyphellaria aurata]|nr:hypothetical protein [Pseudocyphellaria aurata]
MWTPWIYLLLLVAKSWQYDFGPNKAQMCVQACDGGVEYVTFGTTAQTDDYYTGFCQDTLRFESVFLCAKLHCSPWQIMTGVPYYTKPCRTEVHVDTISYDAVIANYSDADIMAMPVIEYSTDPPTDIYNNTDLGAYTSTVVATVLTIHDRASIIVWNMRIVITGM